MYIEKIINFECDQSYTRTVLVARVSSIGGLVPIF